MNCQRTNLILMLIIFTLAFINISHDSNKPNIDLEIYTQNEIYYINNLTVSFEKRNEIIIFKNTLDLKKFMSNETAKNVNLNCK